MKINWDNNFSYNYNQVPKSGVQHVILDGEYKPICNPFFCKEYFQDFVWGEVTKNSFDQYGFKYSPLGILDSCKVALRSEKDSSVKLNEENILGLIKQLEKILNIKTEIKIESIENAVVLSNFGDWLANPIYSSVLLQSLRHTGKFNKEDNVYKNILNGSFNDNYKLQINNGWLYKLFLLENGFYFEQKWEDLKSSSGSHNTGLNSIQFNNLKNKQWN